MKKLLLLSTGGTISQAHDDSGIAFSNDTLSTKSNTFADILCKANSDLDISIKELFNKDSSCIDVEDWKKIITAITDNYDNFDGFIVMHGTNTMAYTCAAVSFAIGNLGKPIVFTGAQVSYAMPGSDATMNIENISRVLNDAVISAGVFCTFGSKVITGARVKKKTEFDFDAFKTFGRVPDLANIGNSITYNKSAIDDHLQHLGTKSKFLRGLTIQNKFSGDIVSITETPGLSPDVFKRLADSGTRGFVLRAYGAGDPNISDDNSAYNLRDAFKFLSDAKIPIVVTTQAPDGVASMNINQMGQAALELGAIPTYDMSMESMTTKLSWLIGNGYLYEEIREQMLISLRGEILVS